MTGPEVSVVCSTYNRAARLPGLLRALEAQSLDRERFEVVLVNNGSADETAAVLAEFERTSDLHVRAVDLAVNRGASGGRNAGWRAAAAPVIAFTDDDCVPDPAWLESGLRRMQGGDLAVLVGQTVPNPEQAQNSGPFSRTQRVNEVTGPRYLNTCNIFYRKHDLEAVEGFDERFETKGGEDTDLGWRILDRGAGVEYAPEVLVLHDVAKGSFRSAYREATTWRDIPLVAARHPKRARPLLIHRVFWKKSHEHVLLALASLVGVAALRRIFPIVGVLPWVYYRLRKAPITSSKKARLRYLPHTFVIDAAEVSTMVRGSIKNRTFVL